MRGSSRLKATIRAMLQHSALAFFILASNPAHSQSILEKYDGATIQFTTLSCSPNNSCATTRNTASISKSGIALPEYPTMRERVIYRTKYGSLVYNIMKNTILFEARYDYKVATTKVTLDGNRCFVVVSSDFIGKMVTTCTINSATTSRQSPDNSRACQIVLEARDEIETLLRRETTESCATSERIKQVSKSVRGANCASKMEEIDRVLKRHDPTACLKERYKRDGGPSEVGVRG